MAGFTSLPLRVLAVAAVLLLVGTGGAFAQQKVGVSSAVNPQVTGAPPGTAPRKLVIGQDVIYNERITTGPTGQTQLLFLDESAMTVGPNSDLTIDRFVYDPKRGTGQLAMSATRGLLRYVGGKLSKHDKAVTVRTTTATLAVRGGAFVMKIDCGRGGGTTASKCETEAAFIFGDGLTVTGLNGASETLIRPGFAITAGPGGTLSRPFRLSPGKLAGFLQLLNGRPGSSGGAPVAPTDAAVVDSGLPETVASIATTAPETTTTEEAPSLPSNSDQTTNPQPNSGGQIIACTADQTCPASSPLVTEVNQPAPVSITYAGRIKSTNGKGTARGFVDQTATGDLPYSSGTLTNGIFTGSVGSVDFSFPLVAGSSTFGPAGTSSNLGPFTGSAYLSPDETFFYASITPTEQPTERVFITGGMAVDSAFYQTTGPGPRPQKPDSNTRLFAFTVQPDAALHSNIPFVRPQAGGNLANAAVSPLYMVAPPTTAIGDASTRSAARALQGSLAINGIGPNQRSTIAVTTGTVHTLESSGLPILNGHLRGSSLQSASGTPVRLGSSLSSMVDANGNSFYGPNVDPKKDAITGFAVDQTQYPSPVSGTVGNRITPSTASEIPLAGTKTNYGFAQAALSSNVPEVTVISPDGIPTTESVGTHRTTQTLSGNFGGLMYTNAQPTPYIVTGGTTISTDAPNNRIQATLSGTAQPSSKVVSTLTMQYGGLTGHARGAFVDDNTFAVVESDARPQQINGVPLAVNGDQKEAGKLYLMSSGVAKPPSSLLPSGASYCDCQYLKWGYWGGDLRTGNPVDSTITRVDRGHINTWVAGVPTALADLNALQGMSATGTYAGHAFGSVYNNGSSYLAAGAFNGTYNFGTQSGTWTVSNFDGHTFSATGKAPLTGANYSFSINDTPGFKGSGSGTFYGKNAANTGGSFAVQSTVGPTYLASGIYAGAKQ